MAQNMSMDAAKPKAKSGRLNAKDLINVGIFTAIYLVVMFACSTLGFIPIFIPLLAVIIPLVEGIVFMLFLTRVKKFGMVLIIGIVVSLFYLPGGMGSFMAPIVIVVGLIAEALLRSGGYQSKWKAILAYGFFSISVFGNLMPIFTSRDAYYNMLASGNFGAEYANTLMSYMPDWIAPILLACCFIFGILGGILGYAVLKKHFKRAGIA